MDEDKKTLSELEMVKMERFQNLKQIEELKKTIMDRDLKSFQIQADNLKLKLELLTHHNDKKQKAKNDVISKSEAITEESRTYNNELAKKYELSDGWGYNPDTGEIVENEND
jgi:hypothetical protein